MTDFSLHAARLYSWLVGWLTVFFYDGLCPEDCRRWSRHVVLFPLRQKHHVIHASHIGRLVVDILVDAGPLVASQRILYHSIWLAAEKRCDCERRWHVNAAGTPLPASWWP